MCHTPRYVRRDSRVAPSSLCTLCGTHWGGYPSRVCPVTTCLACGSPQCMVNGLGRGQCSICYVGLLSGWSGNDKPCGYKGCSSRAVARVGNGARAYVCASHLAHKKPGYVPAQLADRDRTWVLTPTL